MALSSNYYNMINIIMNTLSLIIMFQLLLISPPLLRAEPQFPCFFIIGDSMVDNGNNNNLQTAAKANYLPYGIDFPAGSTGRFSNGRNLADFIAELVGFEKSIPPVSQATNEEDILKGVNYASGGAGILDESGAVFGDVVTLSEQLSNHKSTISKIVELLGSERAAEEHLNSCLYYIGMGNNDYLANYLPQHYSSTSQYTPQQFAARLITEYSNQLQKLYDYGARKVAVFGTGKLGCVPQQVGAYGATKGSLCYEPSNEIAGIFNDNLQLLINHLNNRLPEAKFVLVKDYSDDHSVYGNMKVMDEPCCATSAERYGHCAEGGATCSNRDEYFFWDEFHPSEAANFINAKLAYTYISPLIAHPSIDVW